MNVFIRKRGANPLRIAYSKRYINMVTIYNTPLSTTSEKALFGRPGLGVFKVDINITMITSGASCRDAATVYFVTY